MKNYERPIVVINDDLAEGVYAASGAVVLSECFSGSAYVSQFDGIGGVNQVKAKITHEAEDHHSTSRTMYITFNPAPTAVTYTEKGSISGYDPTTGVLTIGELNDHVGNFETSSDWLITFTPSSNVQPTVTVHVSGCVHHDNQGPCNFD